MELREWLVDVARHNGATPQGGKHYAGFAGHIRKDFPRLAFTPDTARSVGVSLGGQFPTWDEFRSVIRAMLTEATTAGTHHQPGPRVLTDAEREAEADRADREFWTIRIDAAASMTSPAAAHREACDMLELLTRPAGTIHAKDPGAFPRPWALDRLRRIRDATREAMEQPEYMPRTAA
jgi:hypothetical protein